LRLREEAVVLRLELQATLQLKLAARETPNAERRRGESAMHEVLSDTLSETQKAEVRAAW
jgi:hypothetical protein